MKSSTSLVAFFDILGYQAFLRSNSAITAAESIFDLIQHSPTEAIESWRDQTSTASPEWNPSLDNMKSIVFSDTIVVSIEVDPETTKPIVYALFLRVCSRIVKKMFDSGLPVRGVVTIGPFLFRNTCIAGQAVVDAYNITSKLEFAGCVLSESLSVFLDSHFNGDINFWDKYFPYYLYPLKQEEEARSRIVFWKPDPGSDELSLYVRKAFWKWRKDLPKTVDSKVEQTVKMLEFFRYHTDDPNWSDEKA